MKKLIISLGILLTLISITVVVILFGRGYRIFFDGIKPDVSGTGLLVATSSPDGAQVFVNDHLTTATNNTINLTPGEYDIKIFKQGYFSWEKHLKIEKGVVTKAEALLFPTAPKLESITNTGVNVAVMDPSQTKLAYTVSSQSAKKNGIYVLDMTAKPIITLQGLSIQIVEDTLNSFSRTKLSWTPDGSSIIATISALNLNTTYLLKGDGLNQNPSDITETISTTSLTWQRQTLEKHRSQIDSLPRELRKFAENNFEIIAWSPDELKILYRVSKQSTLPIIIKPPLIGVNSTPEQRLLKPGEIYVYDLKEDRNYKILDYKAGFEKSLNWLADSKHIIFVHDQKVEIMEYDGKNTTKIYAGPFVDSFVFPWPDGTKIVILTNLGNTDTAPNLYTIGLK
ncbi:MAG: PEGA domain-containing protein [Candidatus Levybacteria bacterium]|nr:PEGA domain-containing protein [Candidatus Levybacteria bacterium]